MEARLGNYTDSLRESFLSYLKIFISSGNIAQYSAVKITIIDELNKTVKKYQSQESRFISPCLK